MQDILNRKVNTVYKFNEEYNESEFVGGDTLYVVIRRSKDGKKHYIGVTRSNKRHGRRQIIGEIVFRAFHGNIYGWNGYYNVPKKNKYCKDYYDDERHASDIQKYVTHDITFTQMHKNHIVFGFDCSYGPPENYTAQIVIDTVVKNWIKFNNSPYRW